MAKTVVLVGALDTKGEEYAYVKQLIEAQGVATLTVDYGILGPPGYAPEVEREQVLAAGGGDLAYLAGGGHKDAAMAAAAAGLSVVVRELYAAGKLDGILAMGGTGGTSVATAAMRGLPVGVPKLMVSTVGGGDVSAFAGGKDIVFVPSIVDVAGLNRISRVLFAHAAGAIAGMVQVEAPAAGTDKPLVSASMFGNTTPAVDRARHRLEAAGYEVLVFHATGAGGRTMDSLIADGYIAANLDLTTTELADYVCGGVFSAGAARGQAAPRAGIPTVLAPGCVDMANFGSPETVPEQYRSRNLYAWNPNVTLLRTNVEENGRIGEMLAQAANLASGPVAILLPRRGVSMLDSPGGRFWDPEADAACYTALKRRLRPEIAVYELEHNINDPEFADAAAETLLQMLAADGAAR
ncbi:MAG: Tm-1-like ATP-binding domain-containing protein [Caldilineaceae bacterium]|nr:Tm-1-like ATP-binding domain-containing protein [Caldilineaceae bacterium]